MPNNSGIFSLSNYYDKDLSGDIPEKSRESFREYGYFGGGEFRCMVQRIDYSNDTLSSSPRGTFLLRFEGVGGAGNSNYGWHGGRDLFGNSLIQRIDYSNDSQFASSRGSLSSVRVNLTATGNSNFGYFGGGNDPAPTLYSTVDRINYSNDLSVASVRGPLSFSVCQFAATGNSNFGYFGGGSPIPGSPQFSLVNRISYSNDLSVSLVRGNLSVSRSYFTNCATGNSNFGYFAGGINSGTYISIVNRINYSNDTQTASVRGPLSLARGFSAGTGNSNFGYFGGGITPSSPTTSTVNRIDYSNDTTTASVRGTLDVATRGASATSSASFGGSPISQYGVFAKPFGYFGGGTSPGSLSIIHRIDYTSDTTTASTRNSLSLAKYGLSATGNSNFGYFGGGQPSLSTVDRIDYTNDSQTILVRGPLSQSRMRLSSTGNSNFGYFGGGYNQPGTPVYSTIDRVDYGNDTATASIRGPLSSIKYRTSATGTSNFGYFGGGVPGPGNISTIERVNYSNDTATATARSTLTIARNGAAATGNQNFGYFGGGNFPTISVVDRLDYSNDTTASSARGTLVQNIRFSSATGNSNFGYFGGGNNPAIPALYSYIQRIDYSNDLATSSIRSSFPTSLDNSAATSPTAFGGATDFTPTQTFFDIQSMRRIEDTTNYSVKKRALGSFGYFGANYDASLSKIDFSNDLVTASARSVLSLLRNNIAATGNSNFGYFGGGYSITPPSPAVGLSFVERLDYSNDSATVSRRGDLEISTRFREGVSNNNFGYFAGGIDSGTSKSSIGRINYSNDLSTALRKSQLSQSKSFPAATGNNNFGYFGGGYTFPGVTRTTIERIDYSNDNVKPSIRTNLLVIRSAFFYRSFGSAGNSNFGYFGGGGNGSTPVSSVERLDYSNDTSSTSIRGPLTIARNGLKATGNSNFGYFGGGEGFTRVDRVDYSNDSATASIRGPLANSIVGHSVTNARNS